MITKFDQPKIIVFTIPYLITPRVRTINIITRLEQKVSLQIPGTDIKIVKAPFTLQLPVLNMLINLKTDIKE